MNLSIEIFWDVDYSKLDYDKSANWVICRVLEYGSLYDWKEIRKYYGIEKIKQAAITARSVSIKTMHFIHNFFNVPLTDFRCYNSTRSDQTHWMY